MRTRLPVTLTTIILTLIMLLTPGCHARPAPHASAEAQCPQIAELGTMQCSISHNTWIYAADPETLARARAEVSEAAPMFEPSSSPRSTQRSVTRPCGPPEKKPSEKEPRGRSLSRPCQDRLEFRSRCSPSA